MPGKPHPIQYAKVTVNLPMKIWHAVEQMAEDEDIAKTEALRRCISTEVFRRQVESEGGTLVVRRADGETELVRFYY